MRRTTAAILATASLLLASSAAVGVADPLSPSSRGSAAESVGVENWPQWRGPQGNGVAIGTGFPTKWSDTENVAWKVALPGWGTSTPAVWLKRIFVTCQDEGNNALIALDLSGKQLWKATFGEERNARNNKASGANPSPVTDGKHVYVYYKSGDLACVDFDGKTVWLKNLQKEYGPDTLYWDLGTSPVLTGNLLVVACMHSGPSYLAAFDKRTGEVVWKQDRELDAPAESAQSYTTPALFTQDGKQRLAVLGADHVTVHDASNGREIWRFGSLNPEGRRNYRSIASPLVILTPHASSSGNEHNGEGLVIAPYARGGSLTAIRLGGTGDVTDSHKAWVNDKFSADVPTPTAFNGHIYVCTDRGDVACLEAATGKALWSQRVEPNRHRFYSSPIIADGRLYVTREDGVTFVLKLGETFDLLQKNGLYEWTYATPVFVDGRMLIRTVEHLYCIGTQ